MAVLDTVSTHQRHAPTRHAIPAAWYRAGTSKGLFFKKQNLPQDISAWKPIFLSAMGSDDGDAKQLNGMGGGSSTTSKVAVVSKSTRKDVDVEYTFAQVVPDGGRLDMSGNCGNIASGVAPFALDEGIITAPAGRERLKVRILNTNTNKILEASVELDTDGHAYESGTYLMPGLKSSGSPMKISFLKPAGSMTGRILPTGHAEDWIHINTGIRSISVCATLIDVANPFVLVDATTLPDIWHTAGPHAPATMEMMEEIRRAAAVQMGLARDTSEAAQRRGTPKIAVISEPDNGADISVTAFSTGRPHPSVQLTGAVCLSAAMTTPGTVVWRMAQHATDMTDGAGTDGDSAESDQSSSESATEMEGKYEERSSDRRVRIQHPSGIIECDVRACIDKDGVQDVERVTILRTARRLFEGNVFYQSAKEATSI